MTPIHRLILLLPLIVATCVVSILNGNVLCIAGGDHIAMEPDHEAGGCSTVEACPGPDERESTPVDGCTDVSADSDLLRPGNRSMADAATLVSPCFGVPVAVNAGLAASAAMPVPPATSAPPLAMGTVGILSVVLII